MRDSITSSVVARLGICVVAGALLFCPVKAGAVGVTLITHGLNGNVDGWVTGMATNVPNYRRFPGTNFTCYQMSFSNFNSVYYLTASRVAGNAPTNSPEAPAHVSSPHAGV